MCRTCSPTPALGCQEATRLAELSGLSCTVCCADSSVRRPTAPWTCGRAGGAGGAGKAGVWCQRRRLGTPPQQATPIRAMGSGVAVAVHGREALIQSAVIKQ